MAISAEDNRPRRRVAVLDTGTSFGDVAEALGLAKELESGKTCWFARHLSALPRLLT